MSNTVTVTTNWDDVRNEWSKAQQMGHQAVLQVAKVGRMLSELRGDMPMRDFVSRVKQELPDLDLNLTKISRLETLAHNIPLIEEHRPDSQRAALALIKKSKRPSTSERNPAVFEQIKREAEQSRARYGGKSAAPSSDTDQEDSDPEGYVESQFDGSTLATQSDAERVGEGVFTQDEFDLILGCLDPDREADPVQLREAFRVFNGKRQFLVSPGTNPLADRGNVPTREVAAEIAEQQAAENDAEGYSEGRAAA